MELFNKKKEKEELTQEEKLSNLMKNQVEKQEEIQGRLIKNNDMAEGYLLFKLVISLNQGNSGNILGRPEMAKRQLDEMVKLGYDLDKIYEVMIG